MVEYHPAAFASIHAGGILLVFLFDFTSFGVILLLGGSEFSTLEVEIYLQSVKISTCLWLLAFPHSTYIHTDLFHSLHAHHFPFSRPNRATLLRKAISANQNPSREKFFVTVAIFLLSSFFHPAFALPPHPFPHPPRSGPWSTRRSPDMDSPPITTRNFSSIAADRYFMSRQFKPRSIHLDTPA